MSYTDLTQALRDVNVITKTGAMNRQGARMLLKHPALRQQLLDATNFLSQDTSIRARIHAVEFNITEQPKCHCGSVMEFNNQKNRFNTFCPNSTNSSCAMSSSSMRERIKATTHEKYGVSNAMQNQHVREKVNQTNLAKYGSISPMSNSEVQQRSLATIRERYGVDAASDIPGTQDKRAATNVKRYGSTTYAGSTVSPSARAVLADKLQVEQMLLDFSLSEIALSIGTSVSLVRDAVDQHGLQDVVKRKATSSPQRSILNMLDGMGIEYVVNDRSVIAPVELDIYIPAHNLAIEFNGVYFHSEVSGKDKRYHLAKTLACTNQNIQLLHVRSDEWERKQHIVKSRIQSHLGANQKVMARKCTVGVVDAALARSFLDLNHIQGNHSATMTYGLHYDGVLVALMSFIKSRYDSQKQWELLRYCSLRGMNVVGGASKLFAAFRRDQNPDNVVSYCDLRWGSGGVYQQLGFKYSHTSNPNYFYFKRSGDTNKLYSRVQFQKHKLAEVLEEFDPSLTEWENMRTNGYDRIWDCGNSVWHWVNPMLPVAQV